jgi:GNAT superfamily N-acetyltransferase
VVTGPRSPTHPDDPDVTVSTDPARLDRALIHAYLSTESYWASGVPRELVDRSIDHSLPFGLYRLDRQIGFARVVTDHATFGYVSDVFVVAPEQGRGLGRWLVAEVMAHPDLQILRRITLATRDAHELYATSGFRPARAGIDMELRRSNAELYGLATDRESTR